MKYKLNVGTETLLAPCSYQRFVKWHDYLRNNKHAAIKNVEWFAEVYFTELIQKDRYYTVDICNVLQYPNHTICQAMILFKIGLDINITLACSLLFRAFRNYGIADEECIAI